MGNKGGKGKKGESGSDDTKFNKVEMKQITDIFKSVSADGTTLTKENFKIGLAKLKDLGFQDLESTPFYDRLFNLFDLNGDGSVDLHEFFSGLSVLFKGTIDEKLKLSFRAYDLDGSNTISKKELSEMFKSAWLCGFKALVKKHGNDDLSHQELVEFSDEMANLFAESAFDTLDTNNDGMLSFEEFKEFAKAKPKITATLNGHKQEIQITFVDDTV